jgi:hypothetical protein
MSSSSSSVIQDVVDQLLLTGTLYDDLVRTLLRQRRKHDVEGWTSSELLIEIPALRLFFQSNRAFPASYVLASIPGIHCVTRGVVVLYTTTAAAVGQQEEDQAPAAVVASYCNTNESIDRQGEDEHQQLEELPNAISASSTMDSGVSTEESDGEERGEAPVVSSKAADHHADDAPTTTTTTTAVLHPTRRQVKKTNRLGRLAKFEDQLVDFIQAAPDQRIMKARLQKECERIRKNEWTQLKPKLFRKLIESLKKVRSVKINGSTFVVPSSFDPLVDTPPVNQEALKRLEDELVELVRSIGNHRIRVARGCLEEAYQQRYNKPLKLEPTGLFTLKNVLQAMPRLARSKKNRQILIEAPSVPMHFDDDAPLPPPPLTRSRAAQQYSGRCSPTVSAALPPTLADPYARSSDLPPPDLPPGLPQCLSSIRSEIPSAHAELSPGLPHGLPRGLPPGLPRDLPPGYSFRYL